MGKILSPYCGKITQSTVMLVVAMSEEKFEALTNEGDVISVPEASMQGHISEYPMFKLSYLLRKVSCRSIGMDESYWDRDLSQKQWVTDGVNCEVMKVGEGIWKTGKVRIKVVVEFCPDEPSSSQSPLDDLRKQ